MSTSVFPGALDPYTNPTATNPTNSPSLSAGQTLQNDSLVAIEAKVGVNNSAVTTSLDYLLKNSASLDPGHLHSANGFNADLLAGWLSPTETWTYASATTFTVPGDITSRNAPGNKLRWKQGGGYKYGWIKSLSYSTPNTTVTIVGFSTYNLASATITNNGYSYSETPLGFPSLDTVNARAYRNSSASITNNTVQKINYDTTSFNIGGFFDVVTNNRYNCPVDGYYQVTVANQIAAMTDTNRLGSYIYKNGSEDSETIYSIGGSATNSGQVSALLKCLAGDYLEGNVFQNSGGSLNLDNDPRQSYMSVAFIRLALS